MVLLTAGPVRPVGVVWVHPSLGMPHVRGDAGVGVQADGAQVAA